MTFCVLKLEILLIFTEILLEYVLIITTDTIKVQRKLIICGKYA